MYGHPTLRDGIPLKFDLLSQAIENLLSNAHQWPLMNCDKISENTAESLLKTSERFN